MTAECGILQYCKQRGDNHSLEIVFGCTQGPWTWLTYWNLVYGHHGCFACSIVRIPVLCNGNGFNEYPRGKLARKVPFVDTGLQLPRYPKL